MNHTLELNEAFSNILFTEHGHTYIDSSTGQSLISVTTLKKKFEEPYQENFWAVYKAFERSGYTVRYQGSTEYFLLNGERYSPMFDSHVHYDLPITPDQVKREWQLNGLIGRTRGTLLHNYMENKWLRKEVKVVIPDFVVNLSTKDAIEFVRSVDTLKILGNNFYNQFKDTHIPLAQEFVIGDAELDIAGTFDLLLFNKKTGETELWDYKTDKKFETSNKYRMKYFDIDTSELSKYSLQLGMYKYIIEKNTPIHIDKMFVSHFDFKKQENNIYEMNDLNDMIHEFFSKNDHQSTYQ